MSRPQSEAEYLGRLLPPSVAARPVGRRSLLRGVLGAGAGIGMTSLLAACGGDGGDVGGTAAWPGTVTFGATRSAPRSPSSTRRWSRTSSGRAARP